MTITAKRGKVIVRLRDSQCSLTAENAAKLALKLHHAAEKAAKQAKQFSED